MHKKQLFRDKLLFTENPSFIVFAIYNNLRNFNNLFVKLYTVTLIKFIHRVCLTFGPNFALTTLS